MISQEQPVKEQLDHVEFYTTALNRHYTALHEEDQSQTQQIHFRHVCGLNHRNAKCNALLTEI